MFSKPPFSGVIDGYDARSISKATQVLWTPERREVFLLKKDVENPRSVDCLVWPSLFDWEIGLGLTPDERHRLMLDGEKVPSLLRRPIPLWEDSGTLFRQINHLSIPQDHTPFCVVHIHSTCHSDCNLQIGETLVGYDVADESLLSALMNCGYVANDERCIFAEDLNEHHLFDSEDVARRFATLCDRTIEEHAPFQVYAIAIVKADARAAPFE